MRVRILILCIIFFFYQAKAQKPIAFPSEFIDFRIDNQYFSINGIYTFVNRTNKYINNAISFPFAVKTALIDSIKIINLKNLKTVQFKKYEHDIYFDLQMLPYDTIEYNIFYRQALAKKNTYILTTTNTWGAPLKNAVYSLTTIKNIKIISFSYEPDSSKSDSIKTTYFWHKQNFLPQTEFEVIIEK